MTKATTIINIARSVGFPENVLATLLAIAKAESNLEETAIGDLALVNTTWGPSVGLMQIRTLKPPYDAPEPYRSFLILNALKNPETNLKAAYKISKAGTSWNAWSTYKDNSYKKYLAEAQQVVDATPAPLINASTGTIALAAAAGITLAVILTR